MSPPFSTVVGYHTCSRDLAERIATGSDQLQLGRRPHNEDWDWLGTGIYFWVGNYTMARWWNNKIRERDPSFAGATLKYEIALGKCLDLSDAKYLWLLRRHEKSINWAKRGVRPVNKRAPDGHRIAGEYNQRYLDHAVIDDYCTNIEPQIESVYGIFQSGPPIYEGAGLYLYSNAQLAVRQNGLHLMNFVGIDIE